MAILLLSDVHTAHICLSQSRGRYLQIFTMGRGPRRWLTRSSGRRKRARAMPRTSYQRRTSVKRLTASRSRNHCNLRATLSAKVLRKPQATIRAMSLIWLSGEVQTRLESLRLSPGPASCQCQLPLLILCHISSLSVRTDICSALVCCPQLRHGISLHDGGSHEVIK